MKAILVQSPFTQLNAPYPAVHCLEAYLRERGIEAASYDHSIELYRAIFSRPGLARIFADARSATAKRLESGDIDKVAREQLERYFSYESLYLEWIDSLVVFLSGQESGFAHRLAQAVELPRGRRAQALLDAAEGRIGLDAAPELATAILEDLSDLIRYALDTDFGTVRYADRLASSAGSFAEIRASLDSSYIMREFYAPYLERFWTDRAAEIGADETCLVLLSLPFPGTLSGGLACAAAARRALGAGAPGRRAPDSRAIVIAGGGYVSTELRNLSDPGIFDFVDYLSFDAGYGSLESILDALEHPGRAELYRTLCRDGLPGSAGTTRGDSPAGNVSRFSTGPERYAVSERSALETIFPDYRSADFGRYLRVVESGNAMHRLWSDAPWLKYALARGCYWRRCAFCDTELEYVSGYVPARVETLAAAAGAAAARSGIHGIHFVDEAMPMANLLQFARANRERAAAGERPFHYWGNVRFDASWTEGRCELLAASGLVAVSGGIEIASERGLELTGKGFGLAELVLCLVAMRRAGLLVHAYLIYGFPGQSEADILESAEVARQIFASGLVDSAFWHRFVLTRHSRMYAEHRAGKRPELRPIEAERSFADNDLRFEGEEAYDRFDAPLSASLAAWMRGEDLERPIEEWFEAEPRAARGGLPGSGAARGGRRGAMRPAGAVAPELIEALIARAEAELDSRRAAGLPERGRVHWIAGSPLRASGHAGRARLTWAYRGSLESVEGRPEDLERARIAAAIAARPEGSSVAEFREALEGRAIGCVEPRSASPLVLDFLESGLVVE